MLTSTLRGMFAHKLRLVLTTASIVDTVGLTGRQSHRPAQLSGGQQQRVAAARALASRPQVVFADEPTGNLDSATGSEILTLMRDSVDEYGQTIVMVTHDPVAASYAQRVVFLADGSIVDEMSDPTPSRVLDRLKKLGDRSPCSARPSRTWPPASCGS